MQPNNEQTNNGMNMHSGSDRSPVATWLVTGALAAGLAGIGFGFYSHDQATQVAEAQKANLETVTTMQQQVKVLKDQLAAREAREQEIASALAAAEQKAAERQEAQAAQAPIRTKPATSRIAARKATPKPPAEDPRVSQLEKKLSEQDQKLAETQRSVDAARSDLESRINSTSAELNGTIARTSDELKGSIARTSDEVAALRRKGERDYYEFDIPKSKVSQRIGPVGLALRKADVKRKRYNLDMMVDDNKLEKKNVNLYEPVYITTPEWNQPVELVVNKVTKDRVAGYISVPKYKHSELASTGVERQNLASVGSGSRPE